MDAPSVAAFLERRVSLVAGIRPRTPKGMTA
jgi:hypothetical protein